MNALSDNPLASMAGRFSLDEILSFLRRRWLRIGAGMVLGILALLAYWWYAPPVYESTAEVFVMRKDVTAVGVQGGNANETAVNEELLATHMKLIQSKSIIQSALKADDLLNLPSIVEQLHKNEEPADYVVDNIYVRRGGSGQSKAAHVLTISFRHTSDEDAKRVVEAIVSSYRRFLAEKIQNVSVEAAHLIEEAQSKLREDLEAAEGKYEEFRKQAPLLWKGEESTNIHRENYAAIEAELADLGLRYAEASSRLDAVQEALKAFDQSGASELARLSVIDEKTAPRIALLLSADKGASASAAFMALQPERMESARSEFAELLLLKSRRTALADQLGESHPDMIALKKQIDLMEDYIREKAAKLTADKSVSEITPKLVVDTYLEFLRNDLAAIRARRLALETLAEAEKELAQSLVSYELDGENLRQDMLRKQELYDAVVDRLREINIAKDYGGYINEVIVEPELGECIWPDLPICVILGVVLGLGFGLVWAGWREYREALYRNPLDIQAGLGLPVIAHVPKFASNKAEKARRSAESPIDRTVIAAHTPAAVDVEAIKVLRTHLFLLKKSSPGCLVVQMTSPNQGDGKSTLMANLAVTIAQAGRRVLVIDADLRRPAMHRLLGVSSKTGLASVLKGDSPASAAVVRTQIEGLSLMPCGDEPPANPSELLESRRFAELLKDVRSAYDIVLIDTPPVLAVVDPTIVAQLMDGVVLAINVVRDNKAQAERARDALLDVGGKVVGVVVNGVAASSGYDINQGAGYRYGRYYQAAPVPSAPGQSAPVVNPLSATPQRVVEREEVSV
jgi:capsular exopolysaccharide synthesis family protein